MKKAPLRIVIVDPGNSELIREIWKRLRKKGHTVTYHSPKNSLAFYLLLPFIGKRLEADIILTTLTHPLEHLIQRLIGIPVTSWKTIEPMPAQGVDKTYTRIKQQPPEYCMFLGTLAIKENGLDMLLKAFAKIAHKTRYPLLIAGNGRDEKKLRKLVLTLKISKYVMFVGPTYGEKKMQIMAKALFVAYPAQRDMRSRFPLEALASGLPLVAFDIPELNWTTKAVALKAVRYEVDDFARLLKFASQSKTIYTMRKAAKKLGKQLRWDSVISTYVKRIEEAAK